MEWFCFSLCMGVAPITPEPLWGREGLVWMQGREQVELHWQRPWPPAQVWGHSDPEPALRGQLAVTGPVPVWSPAVTARAGVPRQGIPCCGCPEHPSELS